jgi:hypothetical protein
MGTARLDEERSRQLADGAAAGHLVEVDNISGLMAFRRLHPIPSMTGDATSINGASDAC